MAELSSEDAEIYSAGRLPDDDTTQKIVDAALAAARRYCGWYVSPVQTGQTLIIDGPGGHVLSLPTLNLIAVTAVIEEGVALDVTKLDVSRRKGTIQKHSSWNWWSRRNGAISVTMTHGFTEAEAADWRRAVLRLVDLMSLDPVTAGSRDSPQMKRKRVDDVDYEWYEGLISTDDRLKALLSPYRILPSP